MAYAPVRSGAITSTASIGTRSQTIFRSVQASTVPGVKLAYTSFARGLGRVLWG